MADIHRSHPAPPRDWAESFAALPLEGPPVGAWPAISARIDARRRPRWPRWPLWLAAAAALALVAVMPLRRDADDAAPRVAQAAGDAAGSGRVATVSQGSDAPNREAFERLFAESAQLEAVLELARDDRVASGAATVMAGELEAYVAGIDSDLSQPDLAPEQRLALWRQRVDAMRQLVGFASTQRLLAANGDRFDGALASVD